MKLTKKRTIILHRKMWNWLAENPDKNKKDWPGWIHFKHEIDSDCFLCEYVCNESLSCDDCPLDWEMTDGCYGKSYFRLYLESKSEQCRSVMARKIANLKER